MISHMAPAFVSEIIFCLHPEII